MAEIMINARFETLDDAEQAATELRSALGTEVDIRSLSENQSARERMAVDDQTRLAYPAANLSTQTPSPSAALVMGVPGPQADGTIYSDRAYVLEARTDEDSKGLALDILAKYGGRII